MFATGPILKQGWDVMTRNYGVLLGISLIFTLINLAMGLVPFIGPAASLVLSGPLLAGFLYSGVLAYEDRLRFPDMFKGFSFFGQTLGMYWLSVLMFLICAIPLGIGIGLGLAIDPQGDTGLVIVPSAIGALIYLVLVILLVSRLFLWVPILMGTESGVMDSLKSSWAITREPMWSIVLLLVVIHIIGLILALLCYLPLLFLGMPWFLAIYGSACHRLLPAGDAQAATPLVETTM